MVRDYLVEDQYRDAFYCIPQNDLHNYLGYAVLIVIVVWIVSAVVRNK